MATDDGGRNAYGGYGSDWEKADREARRVADLVRRLTWHAHDRSNAYRSLTAEAAAELEHAAEHLASRRELIARCIELGEMSKKLAAHIARRTADGSLAYPHASFADCPVCQLATEIVET